ncbi:hypothetical protein BDC45DRAFT_541250 [Circinella umbellata]|nr:hypothetical protein BDC45DRAFT_541250 [Circinella umbellata]
MSFVHRRKYSYQIHSKTIYAIKNSEEKRERHEAALSLIMNVMRAETPVDFDLKYETFEIWCIDVDEEWDGPKLYQYFEREILQKQTWYRQLKEVYLPSLRRQRVDVLVYILWGLVLPDLMQDHLCMVAKFGLRTMNKAESTRLARVNELNEEAAARIASQEGNTIKVLSFTDENITYDVLIDADDDFIVSYTCSDNQTNDSLCKHMYLLDRSNSSFFFIIIIIIFTNTIITAMSGHRNRRGFICGTSSPSYQAIERSLDFFEELKIQVQKMKDMKTVSVHILNRISTMF